MDNKFALELMLGQTDPAIAALADAESRPTDGVDSVNSSARPFESHSESMVANPPISETTRVRMQADAHTLGSALINEYHQQMSRFINGLDTQQAENLLHDLIHQQFLSVQQQISQEHPALDQETPTIPLLEDADSSSVDESILTDANVEVINAPAYQYDQLLFDDEVSQLHEDGLYPIEDFELDEDSSLREEIVLLEDEPLFTDDDLDLGEFWLSDDALSESDTMTDELLFARDSDAQEEWEQANWFGDGRSLNQPSNPSEDSSVSLAWASQSSSIATTDVATASVPEDGVIERGEIGFSSVAEPVEFPASALTATFTANSELDAALAEESSQSLAIVSVDSPDSDEAVLSSDLVQQTVQPSFLELRNPLINRTVAGVSISLAVASTVGGYFLLVSPEVFDQGTSTLNSATKKYQAGDFDAAIQLAQSVAPESDLYDDAQVAIAQWQKDWQAAETEFKSLESAFASQKWSNVLNHADRIPEIAFWQEKISPMVQQSREQVELQANQKLQQAYQLASMREFTQALQLLRQIPPESSVYAIVPTKISEYTQKQGIRASYLLQQAYNYAAERNFTDALSYLDQVPEGTSSYPIAQRKVVEYTEKQNIRADYLFLRAENRAAVRDFTGAIAHLRQIPQSTRIYDKAQEMIVSYTAAEQQRVVENQPTNPATANPANSQQPVKATAPVSNVDANTAIDVQPPSNLPPIFPNGNPGNF
jgi:tetratricopeptide (TPR) repeat protein